MKVNVADGRIIQHFRRKEEAWLSTRWVALLCGLLMLSGSLFMFERIWSTVAPDQILMILCLLVAPATGAVLVASPAGIVYTLIFWNGCPVRKLVLRLAGEIEPLAK